MNHILVLKDGQPNMRLPMPTNNTQQKLLDQVGSMAGVTLKLMPGSCFNN